MLPSIGGNFALHVFSRMDARPGQLTHTEDSYIAVVPLHKHLHYLNDCSMLLESEWPARARYRREILKRSLYPFPTSLLLILNKKSQSTNRVVGHCRIKLVPGVSRCCFIESVVIANELRGNGWGRFLMRHAEYYALREGMINVYLETKKDNAVFYEKLDYIYTNPLTLHGVFTKDDDNNKVTNDSSGGIPNVPLKYNDADSSANFPTANGSVPTPPPLPPMAAYNSGGRNNVVSDRVEPKMMMKKCLSNIAVFEQQCHHNTAVSL